MGKTIGIDLGTTNSCMAVLEGGEPTVIENAEGGRTTPSVVAFTQSGERLVGTVAKRQAVTNPQNTVFSIKRFMGRKEAEVREEESIVPYKVVSGPGGDARVEAGGKQYSPPEISAMILQKLKTDAEAYLGETVDSAVITVPAYFNDDQRQATKDAGKIAGLDVKRIINEPTAASLAYGLDKESDQTILVFDLGGGTFDVSVLEIGDGVFEVKATAGDNHLGGDNFDKAIVDWLVSEFKKSQGIDLSGRPDGAPASLRGGREGQDRALHHAGDADQPAVHHGRRQRPQAPRHAPDPREAQRADELDLLDRTVAPVRQALDDAKDKGAANIDHVVLVGGMTRMPAVQEKVKELTGKEPHRGVNPDEVVAVGAAIQAGVLAGDVKDVLLLDVTPLTLGIETKGGVMTKLIERNTTIPTRKSRGLLDGRGQPAVGRDPRAPGRARDGHLQQVAGQVPADRHPAGAARHPADRGRVRHRRQRHPQRLGQGPRHRQGAEDRDQVRLRPLRRRDQADGGRRRVARRGRPPPRELAEARNNGENAAYQAERQLKELGDAGRRELQGRDRGRDQGGPRVADLARTRPRSTPRPRRCSRRSTRSPRRCTSAPRSRRHHPPAQRTAPTAPARRPTARARRTSSTPRSWTRASKPWSRTATSAPRSSRRASLRRRFRLRRARPGAGRARRRSAAIRYVPEPQPAPADSEPDKLEATAEATPEDALERDVEQISTKAEKADEYLALAQRTKADFENYRKRAARETAAAQERGVAKLAQELLPAVDNLDRALEAAQHDADNGASTLVSGIKLVHADVIAALSRAGDRALLAEGRAVRPTAPRGDRAAAGRGRGAGDDRRGLPARLPAR